MSESTNNDGRVIMVGRSGDFLAPTLEQQVVRLNAVVALLATEMDLRDDEYRAWRPSPSPRTELRMSAEEQVERILYMERYA
jgi:hypothetical protein